jgi:hypothetical protein
VTQPTANDVTGSRPAEPPQLTASRTLGFLDELRTPYVDRHEDHTSWHRLTAGRPGATLYWYAGDAADPVVGVTAWTIPIWARVAPDAAVAEHVRGLEGLWYRDVPVLDGDGAVRTWIWTSEEGGTILPFDPDEVFANYRSERYLRVAASWTTRATALARLAFYTLKPLIPRKAQRAVRRAFSRRQARSTFPRWPVETSLHDLTDRLAERAVAVAGRPLPYLKSWPGGREWALVLTHDVETAAGRDGIERLRAVESRLGLRSSWNLVAERYEVSDALVEHLHAVGCEVGVHGLRHDGRDLAPARTLARRLPEMRRWADRWQAVGFRAPATQRYWDRMPTLGFDYDSSYPDTDPYEPMSGGCCSWLPFFNQGMVELPITMPQDHTIFTILRIGDPVWHEKVAALKRRGGMVLLDTHPDYMLEDAPLRAYERLLAAYSRDPAAWTALPREVSDWWRRRAATSLRWVDGSWRPSGPAAGEASIGFLMPAAAVPGRAPSAGSSEGS